MNVNKILQGFGFSFSISFCIKITRHELFVVNCDKESAQYKELKATGEALLGSDDFQAKLAQAKAMRKTRLAVS